MKTRQNFPDDENGDVLRQMQGSGDDLSKARDIDFTVVFPSEDVARKFNAGFTAIGYPGKIVNAGTVPELPWDVVIVKHMVPTHAGITAFEAELDDAARVLGGRNDGWGCFEQRKDVH